jgi:hypothetical protein
MTSKTKPVTLSLAAAFDAEVDLDGAALEPAAATRGLNAGLGHFREAKQVAIERPRGVFSARRNGDLHMVDGAEHQPTEPSSEIATNFWASTANSMGSSCRTSLTKPLTSSWTASSCERPRCWA